jgi:hypothetical protein
MSTFTVRRWCTNPVARGTFCQAFARSVRRQGSGRDLVILIVHLESLPEKVSILTQVAPERAKAFESCSMPRSATDAVGEYVIVMVIRCTWL